MPSLLDLLGETWPARMAKSAWSAAKLPGDVYAGRTDPLSEEGIGRAADLGGMVMGGSYASAPRGAMGAGPVKPIRAYHGSPYDFERFDLSKIGTGEGAQVYGHGLYFAENPAVAKQYRETLAPSRGKLPDDIISLPPEMRQAIMAHAGSDVDAVTAAKRAQYMSSALREIDLPKVTDMVERARVAKQGRMYEVNINADPAHMLDWDAIVPKGAPVRGMIADDAMKRTGSAYADVRNAGKDAFLSATSPELTGEGAYRSLVRANLDAPRGEAVVRATDALREAGIPGIKYLDQGSRVTGPAGTNFAANFGDRAEALTAAQRSLASASGPRDIRKWEDIVADLSRHETSNYVLFRDDIIDIVKKYGLAGAAAIYGISQDEAKAAMDNPKDKKMSIGRQTYGDEE